MPKLSRLHFLANAVGDEAYAHAKQQALDGGPQSPAQLFEVIAETHASLSENVFVVRILGGTHSTSGGKRIATVQAKVPEGWRKEGF